MAGEAFRATPGASQEAPGAWNRRSIGRGALAGLILIVAGLIYWWLRGRLLVSPGLGQPPVSQFDWLLNNLLLLLAVFVPAVFLAGELLPRSWRGLIRRLLGIIVAVILFLAVYRLFATLRVLMSPAAWGQLVIISLAAAAFLAIFPISYLAYSRTVHPQLQKRLEEDITLLGLFDSRQVGARQRAKELYENAFQPLHYWLFILLIVFISVILILSFLFRDRLGPLSADKLYLVFFSFLGAYVFSVQELVRRYQTNDLRPQVYSSILVRFLIAAVVTYAAASILIDSGAVLASQPDQNAAVATATPAAVVPADEQPAGEESTVLDETAATPNRAGLITEAETEVPIWAVVLAFVVGMIPARGTRWMSQRTSSVLGNDRPLAPTLPLTDISGISSWHEARLLEMGLDDAQNLATVDLLKMLLMTRFDTEEVINWIDQAILYARIGGKLPQFRANGITTYHEYRVRIRALRNITDDAKRDASAESLRTQLTLTNKEELFALDDPSNYPNYIQIRRYYRNRPRLYQGRADEGLGRLLRQEGLSDSELEADVLENLVEEAQTIAEDLRLEPNNAAAWANLAALRVAIGEKTGDAAYYERATEACRQSLNLNARQPDVYITLGLAHNQLGQLDEAIAAYNNALNLDAGRKETYYYRGLAKHDKAFAAAGSAPDAALLGEALQDFNQAISLDDRYAIAWLFKGKALNDLQRCREAIAAFEHYYLLGDRALHRLWLGWGEALLNSGNASEAAAKLDQALAIKNDLTKAAVLRGIAADRLGDTDRAVTSLLRAISLAQTRSEPTLEREARELLCRTVLNRTPLRTNLARLDDYSAVLAICGTDGSDPARLGVRNLVQSIYNQASEQKATNPEMAQEALAWVVRNASDTPFGLLARTDWEAMTGRTWTA